MALVGPIRAGRLRSFNVFNHYNATKSEQPLHRFVSSSQKNVIKRNGWTSTLFSYRYIQDKNVDCLLNFEHLPNFLCFTVV